MTLSENVTQSLFSSLKHKRNMSSAEMLYLIQTKKKNKEKEEDYKAEK